MSDASPSRMGSPAQSGQADLDGDEDRGLGPAPMEGLDQSDEMGGPEAADEPVSSQAQEVPQGPSGSDQLAPQPGPAHRGYPRASQTRPDDGVSGSIRAGSLLSRPSSALGWPGGAAEGSNAHELWASSSGYHSRGSLDAGEDNSPDAPGGGVVTSGLPQSTSSSVRLVSAPGFSPQPSSSHSPFSASSSAAAGQPSGSGLPSSSHMASGSGCLSRGGTAAISSSGLISRQNSQVVPESPQSSGYSAINMAHSPLSGPAQLLQGTSEVSHPPSPRVPNGIGSTTHKRERSPSPVPGPSGLAMAKRFIPHRRIPIPGPSRLHIPVSTSSEARPSSPRRALSPLTPVDNFVISSSTGLMDSQPPSPVGVEAMNIDNDLSGPSPSLRPSRELRMVPDNDDMVDSTVDSSGIPLTASNSHASLEGGEFCQSSKYCNSSEDDDDLGLSMVDRSVGEMRFRPPINPEPHSDGSDSNDGGISTSGQVDEGQFRLVPNDPDDESFNQTHPPIRHPSDDDEDDDGGHNHPVSTQAHNNQAGAARSTLNSLYDNPTPGPSREAVPRVSYPSTTKADGGDSFFHCDSDLGLANYAEAVDEGDANLSSTFQAIDSAEPPVDLEDIQLQRLVPENAPASRPEEAGDYAPSGSSKYLLLPDYSLSPSKSEALQSVGEALGIGASFSGLPISLQEPSEESAESMGNQHSSILESMTGPLKSSKDNGSSSNNNQPTSNGTKNGKPEKPSPDQTDSHESPNLGGTQHTFSVSLETPPILSSLRPKRLFHEKNAIIETEGTFFETSDMIRDFLTAPEDDEEISFSRGKRLRNTRTVWCPECRVHYDDRCYLHMNETEVSADIPLQISDTPIPSRARASLPSSHLQIREVERLEKGSDRRFGVFAKKKIPKNCKFGPLEGQRLVAKPLNGNFLFLIQHDNGEVTLMDASDQDESNWMGMVRPANHGDEQNLTLIQDQDQLYFITTRRINHRQEMRVWYSPDYAKARNLPLLHVTNGESCATARSKGGLQPTKKARSGSQKKSKRVKVILPEKLSPSASDNRVSPLNRVKCLECELCFHSLGALKIHTFSHVDPDDSNGPNEVTVTEALSEAGRNAELLDSAEMLFQCPECEVQHENWLKLVSHVDVHGTLADVSTEIHSRDGARKNAFKCVDCYKSFSSEERLKRHAAVHGSDDLKPLSCQKCGKRFLTKSALACHVKIHVSTDTAYDCPICGMEFMQIVALKEHVHIHRVEGKYDCPFCQKDFSEYPLIRKHIRAFHSEKKHNCPHCSKSFASADKLKIHSVIHSDLKEFLCNDCGKQFRRKDKLKEHWNRMHSQKNNNSINASVEDSYKLQKNISLEVDSPGSANENIPPEKDPKKFIPKVSPYDYHRFIYKCHECFLGFKRRGMLVNHLAKRHPDISPETVPELNLPILKTTKDYFCQYCSKVYKSSSKRKAHILKNHPGKKLPVSARDKSIEQAGVLNPTFSATVGSITSLPHNCPFCHKQYASHAKLLQHQRHKHNGESPCDILMSDEFPMATIEDSGQDRILEVGTSPAPNNHTHPPDSKIADPEGGQDTWAQPADLGPDQPSLAPTQSGGTEIKLQTMDGDIVQLTPVPQDEALRLASSGATVIHVPQSLDK
eukprot:maker-scaffold430_size173499-snap-gene-0.50 protein:Tk07001 transcript:maker-scaffold430_size173499-snap-gene-0.50-mRNA-1 annotation:"pr domain zinc finger protein 5-like isoform 1"